MLSDRISGPLGFNFFRHGPTTRPSLERTADKASLLSDRVKLFRAEARVKGIVGDSVGVFDLIHPDRARTHNQSKSAVLRLMVSHGWSIRSPTTDTTQGERDFGVWSKISQASNDEGRKIWLCRDFPQCTDVSQATCFFRSFRL